MADILLIWKNNSLERYFLIDQKSSIINLLKKRSNCFLNENNSDKEEYELWCIKAAVSNKKIWIPNAVKNWQGFLLKNEIFLPFNKKIKIDSIISIGKY